MPSLFFSSAPIGSGLPCSHPWSESASACQDVSLVIFTPLAGVFHDATIISMYYKSLRSYFSKD